MPIPQPNLIEKLALIDFFSAQKQDEGESFPTTRSFDSITLRDPISMPISSGTMSIEHAQCINTGDFRKVVQAHFLRSTSITSVIELWLAIASNTAQKTSWISLSGDEIDELREKATRSLYHSKDIGIDLSGELPSFCYKNNIMKYVKTSVDLIKAYFPSHERISAELVEDTETNEKWVLLNVFIKDEINRILDMYDKYTEEWIDKVPWPDRSKVRISYHPI